jgi:hypothetical protein
VCVCLAASRYQTHAPLLPRAPQSLQTLADAPGFTAVPGRVFDDDTQDFRAVSCPRAFFEVACGSRFAAKLQQCHDGYPTVRVGPEGC